MSEMLREKVAGLPRYEPQGEPNHHNGAAWMAEDAAGEWIKRDDVLVSLAAAPQPAPDREALMEVIAEARGHFTPREMAWAGNGYHDEDRAIADALLARGLRLPGGEETMAWAVVGKDRKPQAMSVTPFEDTVRHLAKLSDGRAVRVAIRVVEGGDDAA